MLTGTIARSPRAGGCSSRSISRRRSPLAQAASATSLTVTPSRRPISLRSASGTRTGANRRSWPIGTFRDVLAAPDTPSRTSSDASERERASAYHGCSAA